MKAFGNLKVPLKKNYKTENGWLRAVYRKNKEIIDARAGDFKTFKIAVTDYVKYGDVNTVRQGLQKLSRTIHPEYGFMKRNELQQELISNAMKGQRKKFKEQTGERFNQANLHYNSKTKEWDYTNEKGQTIAHFADIKQTGYRAGQARYRT